MYLFANKQTITSVISDDKTIIYLMFQKVTKTLFYTVLPQLLTEMRAGNPACAVILSYQDVRAGWGQAANLLHVLAVTKQHLAAWDSLRTP